MKVKPLPYAQIRSRFNVPRRIVSPFHPVQRFSASTARLYCSDSRGQDTSKRVAIDCVSESDNIHHHAASSGHEKPQNSRSLYTGRSSAFQISSSPLLDALLTSIVGLGIVFIGGIAYIAWYKKNVLDKIEKAFDGGYDPALELANFGEELGLSQNPDEDEQPMERLRRKEQNLIDEIIKGNTKGHYYFLIGPKGGSKSTMMLDAMRSIHAEGVSVLDAHPDLEVFRLRLGKALNYEFHEDSQTGLFQRRDPRESLNKLEKVALRRAKRTKRPVVLVFNNIQHFNNDEDGRNMLLQLQQKAETWAAGDATGSSISAVSRDDFWPYLLMRKAANRMHVVSIGDLTSDKACHALTRMRMARHKLQPDWGTVEQVVSLVGGRISYLSKISKAGDMLKSAREILKWEKAWLLSQIGLIPDCDDDVMDEQKWSSCSWLLLREFVKLYRQRQIDCGAAGQSWDPTEMPAISFERCRQIMTRADFIEELDRSNIISIDVNLDVRPDSVLILHAACEVVERDGFDDILNNVRDRIDEIESLHRTRELTFKDVPGGGKINLKLHVEKSPESRWW
ncbi:hypothetical protein J3A83DRAFT_4356189 [Scleroderma citrinum]